MNMILIEVGVISALVGFVIFLAYDDKKNRALRKIEDQEEDRQRQLSEARSNDEKND